MAEAVIGRALVFVLEDFVGLVDFLEAMFAGIIAGIAVGVNFLRQPPVGALELFDRGAALAAQHFVKVALAHCDVSRGRETGNLE